MPPNRHGVFRNNAPPAQKYRAQTWMEFRRTPLEHNEDDESQLRALEALPDNEWSQRDMELFEELMDRKEERRERKRAALRRELESYYDHLSLPPLPPPLPKSSLWHMERQPSAYKVAEVIPFFAACDEGSLDAVRQWVTDKKDVLRPIGLRDGLVCAARNNHIDVARYLLEEGKAAITGGVVEAACDLRSLALLELCVEYGYHPDQRVPSEDGSFGTALAHCVDNETITQFLLQHGANPDIAPFHDNRCIGWGLRAAPPMDRTSGACLDRAVAKRSSNIVRLLLAHGANPKYARPVQAVAIRRLRYLRGDIEDTADNYDWRDVMRLLLRHGADVDGVTFYGGTALTCAVGSGLWDVAEFLLEQGADPRIKVPNTKLDAFGTAAKAAGIAWEVAQVGEYLAYLCDYLDPDQRYGVVPPFPVQARQNPLVSIVERARKKRKEELASTSLTTAKKMVGSGDF